MSTSSMPNRLLSQIRSQYYSETVPHLVVALEGCLKTHLEAVNDLLPLTLYDHPRVPLAHVPEKQTRQRFNPHGQTSTIHSDLR